MVPALAVQQAGLGVYTADNMNTAVQGGVMLADLQSFSGVQNMCVYMIGYSAIGDGGQGMWAWNPTLSAGNNTTTILPNGSVQGGWQRMSLDTP